MIEITEQSRWFKLLKNQYLNIRAKNYVFKLHILIYRFVTLITLKRRSQLKYADTYHQTL